MRKPPKRWLNVFEPVDSLVEEREAEQARDEEDECCQHEQ